MGFGRRRNAHDISVPSPTDNAHGGDWHEGKPAQGLPHLQLLDSP